MNERCFSYPYIPTGGIQKRSGAFQICVFRHRKRLQGSGIGSHDGSIYFPEYKDFYGELDAVSGMIVFKEASPLSLKREELEVEGINLIWRNAKLRGAGMKRVKTLLSAAEHSVGSREALETASMEIQIPVGSL